VAVQCHSWVLMTMTKLYETNYYGFDESATKAIVYAFDSLEERDEFYDLEHDERCDFFGFFDQSGCIVMPGGQYHTYHFEQSNGLLVVYDTLSLNV